MCMCTCMLHGHAACVAVLLRALKADEARRDPLEDEIVSALGRRRAQPLALCGRDHAALLEPLEPGIRVQHAEGLGVAHVRPEHDLEQPELGGGPFERLLRCGRVLAARRVARRVRGLEVSRWVGRYVCR